MNRKNIIKKIAAVGGITLMGAATALGALAYDLGTYPTGFIQDGRFNGKIVVGERASTSDVLGSIDIAASLQGAAVTPGAGAYGNSTIALSGDVSQIGTGSDRLELREAVGKVTDTLTNSNLQSLSGGRLTTAEGTTDYNQYLRFNSNVDQNGVTQTTNQLQDFGVDYIDNRDNVLGDYLVMEQTDRPVFEWQLQFSQGLKSKVDSTGRMRDIEDRTVNILGTDFNVVRATVDQNNNVAMTLMGGAVADTLREGETKTYTINGVDYEVTLVFVSDPASGATNPEVKFSVNGEITKALQRGDTDTLSGGLQIGVRDILVNAREGVASFYLGADKIDLGPSLATTDAFQTGKVSINNQNINQALLNIRGDNYNGGTQTGGLPSRFEITSIKYRLRMDAISGSDVYITAGHGLRENLRYPQGLLSPSLDIMYAGLTTPQITNLGVTARGNDQYDLQFTNLQNVAYDTYLVSNRGGIFKFGSDKDNLVFVEASGPTRPNIGLNDYFVVSDARSDLDKAVTSILRYEDIDTTNHILYFTDIGGGGQNRQVTVSQSSAPNSTGFGQGDLVVGGHTFRVYVENWNTTGAHSIAVDQTANGVVNSDPTSFTVLGGGVLSVASVSGTSNGTFTTLSGSQLGAVDGLGKSISGASNSTFTGNVTVQFTLRTLAKNFDTSSNGDEYINWTVSPTTVGSNPQVTLAIGEGNVRGPLMNQSSTLRFKHFRLTTDRADSVNYKGMSDFGVSILENVPNSGNNPNTLTLGYPAAQRLAQVFVIGSNATTAGSTTSRTTGRTTGGNATSQGFGTMTGATGTVNPLGVGIAVLDKDAPAVGSENLIVVGGPCANTVAATLLGNPSNCAEGFQPGRAEIRTFDRGGRTAILVAGYEATETLGASRVLAAYRDYPLRGSNADVVVADLNNIRVQQGGNATGGTTGRTTGGNATGNITGGGTTGGTTYGSPAGNATNPYVTGNSSLNSSTYGTLGNNTNTTTGGGTRTAGSAGTTGGGTGTGTSGDTGTGAGGTGTGAGGGTGGY
jgi:hypothetical protein